MLKSKQITKFAIAGKILDFSFKDGDLIKYIQLQTYKGNIWIKVSKQLRSSLKSKLSIGDTVFIEGEKHLDRKNGEFKLKACLVTLKQSEKAMQLASIAKPMPSNPTIAFGNNGAKTTILVCQKSDCQKRGSQSICRLLEQTLRDRGLDESITIKKVGCIKQCKSGPHVVLMPDKTRYSQVKPNRIPELIEKHFPAAKHSQSA